MNSKKNLIKVVILLIVSILIILFVINISRKPFMKFTSIPKEDIGDSMELVFLNLAKADSIIIRHMDKVLLIDTGEVEDGPYIVKSLKDIGVGKIDYLILTHPDKDHIGGAVDIINSMEIGMIIQSSLQNGKSIQKLLNATIEEKGIESMVPHNNYKFSLGEVNVEVFPPEKASYKKDNDYSLLTLINHEELNYFFAGDAEKKRLKEALKYNLPKVDLYKVAHHGRYNSKSREMIQLISPRISIITNTRADSELIEALESEGSEILYTGEEYIRFLSDGEKLIRK